MKIEMVKLNRIKYAFSEEEKGRLISDGYVTAQTKMEKQQTTDLGDGKPLEPDSGQTADPEDDKPPESDNGQTSNTDKSQTTSKRGTRKK